MKEVYVGCDCRPLIEAGEALQSDVHTQEMAISALERVVELRQQTPGDEARDFYDHHHWYYPKRLYKYSDEKRLRRKFVTKMRRDNHEWIENTFGPPRKPTLEEIKEKVK